LLGRVSNTIINVMALLLMWTLQVLLTNVKAKLNKISIKSETKSHLNSWCCYIAFCNSYVFYNTQYPLHTYDLFIIQHLYFGTLMWLWSLCDIKYVKTIGVSQYHAITLYRVIFMHFYIIVLDILPNKYYISLLLLTTN